MNDHIVNLKLLGITFFTKAFTLLVSTGFLATIATIISIAAGSLAVLNYLVIFSEKKVFTRLWNKLCPKHKRKD